MEEHQSMDEQFLKKVHQIIDDNIGNEFFTVEKLAQDVGLSRSMLHRKLIKLTGKSASETITDQRLKKACQLLKNNETNVSETAYKVGFKNPSYFNKVFKRYYDVSPGALRNSVLLSTNKNNPKNLWESATARLQKMNLAIKLILLIASISLCSFIFYRLFISPPANQSIAILPLENLTGNANNDYLIDGIQNALIGQLGQIASLRVISRNSTLRYKNSGMPLADIADELNVNILVEGSVLSAGDSIHLLIKVVKTNPEERYLMANNYNSRISNILKLQADVTIDVIKSIRANISKEEKDVLNNSPVVNPDVYKEYLRGMYQLHQGSDLTFEQGIKTLQNAIDIDPGEPFGYAGIALGYAILGHGQINSQGAFNKAINYANKAIKLNPAMDEPYTALSILNLYYDWNWTQANTSFKNALAINPSNSIANAHYAWYHIMFDNQDKAIYYAKTATEVEPLSAAYHAWLGLIFCYCNDYENAELAAHKALELNIDAAYANLVLGWIYLKKQRYFKAMEYHERLPDGLYWDALLADCYVKCNKKSKALALWLKYNKQVDENINICHMGLMAASLGKKDTAFLYLNKAVDQKVYPITYINFYNNSESLRNDVRYTHLLNKMKLPFKHYN